MKKSILRTLLLGLLGLTACWKAPVIPEPEPIEPEDRTAVFTAEISISGDTGNFLCNGSFFALPSNSIPLYDGDGNAYELKDGTLYADDMGSMSVSTSADAEFLRGVIVCVIKDNAPATLNLGVKLLKDGELLLSGEWDIKCPEQVGASISFDSDSEEIKFEEF